MKTKKSKGGFKKRTTAETLADRDTLALVKAAAKKTPTGGYWFPQVKGDAIAGILIATGEEQGQFGVQKTLTIGTPKGARVVRCNRWLENEIERAKPKTGRRIAIVYQGDVKVGRGRPSRSFTVACQ